MARGLQKQQSQQKNAEAAKKKAGGNSNLKIREAALKVTCPKCFTPMSDYRNLKGHYDAKHPKDELPPESQFQK